jgi:hypothetical protein
MSRGIRACPGTSAPSRGFPPAHGKENRPRNLGGSIGSMDVSNLPVGQVDALGRSRPLNKWYPPMHSLSPDGQPEFLLQAFLDPLP